LTSHSFNEILILGDTNFDINYNNNGFKIFDSFLKSVNISPCDAMIDNGNIVFTYVNESLQSTSRIDHFFATDHLKKSCIVDVSVIDSCLNFSDHKPIALTLNLQSFLASGSIQKQMNVFKSVHYNIRWDKGDLALYYSMCRESLSNINVNYACFNCSDQCSDQSHKDMIESLYNSIVYSLRNAEELSIPRMPGNGLKPFWNTELNDLKQRSMFWHSIWNSAGKPQSGLLFQIKTSCKLNYKLAIKMHC